MLFPKTSYLLFFYLFGEVMKRDTFSHNVLGRCALGLFYN
jgi:hypothetical protein